MKNYIFLWGCDATGGEFELDISEEEVELIKEAYRDGFTCLEDVSDLDDLRERAIQKLDFYDPELGQDIRIYFPEEITEEAYAEDEQ